MYLIELIERHDVASHPLHRQSLENSRQNTKSYKQFAMKGPSRVEVCHKKSRSTLILKLKLRESMGSPF